MTSTDVHNPQDLKTEDWAGDMGATWLANLSGFEGMIAPIGKALLARAGYQAGETVLDIGCGGGATTIAIAQSVAPSGHALGIDISPDLKAAALARAAAAGVENAHFLCADATTVRLQDAPFDRLCSRFGCMFFEDPAAAFSNLHGLLRKNGRIDLAVWAAPRDNPWMMDMMAIVKTYIDVPPAIPRAPGPFAFEDLDYVRDILDASGFKDMDVVPHEGLQPVGGAGASPQTAVDFALNSIAQGRLVKTTDASITLKAGQDLHDLFARHHVPLKGVMMRGKAWLVSARA
ncbi:methyltransferase [Iodidimonas gelatinilytica]|uniref:Methyltransferase n=1 Tax=Iodidimonas gelatinilytica TaxID=1236966 RepID=A0A5A7MR05_9PROT|nr:class I SAM-dependent methyltransferase [Iodidimonas gelatinilytica]GEQ97395.1 methyltransferase [Iodidimonas gelatinilytica]